MEAKFDPLNIFICISGIWKSINSLASMLEFTGANLAFQLVICHEKEVPEDNQWRTAVNKNSRLFREDLHLPGFSCRGLSRDKALRGAAGHSFLPLTCCLQISPFQTAVQTHPWEHKRRTCQSLTTSMCWNLLLDLQARLTEA